MTNLRISIPCLFCLLLAAGISTLFGQTISLQKDVHVPPGETQENIFVIGGSVLVEGLVRQSVIALGGSIVISGRVGEDVVGIGTNITLTDTAGISGDVVALGGTLDREPGSMISGDMIFFKTSEFSERILKDGWLKGTLSLSMFPFLLVIKLMSFILWLIVAVAGAALFPRQIVFAAEQVRKAFWPVFFIGLTAIIVFSSLVIFSALLSILLIGIPILLALIGAGLIISIFGRIVLFYLLGESILKALKAGRISVALAALLGLIIVSLGGLIPVAGALFTFFLSIVGWGAVLRTKFGTTENWFQRYPVVR